MALPFDNRKDDSVPWISRDRKFLSSIVSLRLPGARGDEIRGFNRNSRAWAFLVIGGGAILRGYGLVPVCQVMLAASCINLILSVGLTRLRFTPLRFQPSRETVKVLMQQALPFAVGNLFNLLYFRVDAIMLSKLSSEGVDANTWYGLAYTIVNAFTILPGAFMMGAMFPVLSRTWEREKGRFPGAYTFGMRWMVLSGFPLAVGLSLLSPEITAVLFPTYTPSEVGKIATALQWLSWAGGLIFVTTAVQAVLRGDRQTPCILSSHGGNCTPEHLPEYIFDSTLQPCRCGESDGYERGISAHFWDRLHLKKHYQIPRNPSYIPHTFESNLSLCSDGYRFGTVKGFSLHLGADSAGGAVLWWRDRHFWANSGQNLGLINSPYFTITTRCVAAKSSAKNRKK